MIRLMDGQESLWNAGLKHLPEEDFDITEILDLIPVSSYVWEAAPLFHPKGSAKALGFVKERRGRILQGKVNAVVRGLRWRGSHENLTGKRAQTLERICGYFENTDLVTFSPK